MKPRQLWWVVGALLAAGGCATAPRAPDADLVGPTQSLSLRTDPPGAACALSRDGKVLATVEATPGVAQVPRNFRWSGYGFLWHEPEADAIPACGFIAEAGTEVLKEDADARQTESD